MLVCTPCSNSGNKIIWGRGAVRVVTLNQFYPLAECQAIASEKKKKPGSPQCKEMGWLISLNSHLNLFTCCWGFDACHEGVTGSVPAYASPRCHHCSAFQGTFVV